jgi:hypothetical protein
MSRVGRANEQLDWLLARFVGATSGVMHAVVVSGDGLRMAASQALGSTVDDPLAAAASGLVSLSNGVAALLERGPTSQVIVEMAGGHVFLTPISKDSVLVVVADRQCDMGMIGYEMTILATQMGHALTPLPRVSPDGSP